MFVQALGKRLAAVGLAMTLVISGFASTSHAADAASSADDGTTTTAQTDSAADVAVEESTTDATGTEADADAESDAATETQATAEAGTEQATSSSKALATVQTYAAAAAAAATTTSGTVTALTLSVAEDGTTNADGTWDADDSAGNDSGIQNGIVRTQDTVLYQWSYTVASAGDVTLVQTLPDEMVWVASESTVSCEEGTGAVSSDGHTLTCTLADQSTGGQQYRVRAKVASGANGDVVTSTLTSGSVSSSASVQISATPTVSIVTSADSSFGAVLMNGVSGRYVKFRAAFYMPIDSNRGVKGAEALSDDAFTLTLDTSSMGSNVVLYQDCTSTLDSFTSSNWSNLAGGGTWSCEQDAEAGTITLTATGVVSDLSSYISGSSRAYITGVEVQLWMPSEDYTSGETLSLQLSGFNPVSISGAPNWGEEYGTPGQAIGSALISHVNGESFTFDTTESMRTGLSSVFAGNGSGSFGAYAPSGSGGISAGNAPMSPGETFYYGGYLRNNSPTLTDYTTITVCLTWDETLLTAAGSPVRGTNNASVVGEITGVEYASLDMSSDEDRRSADCGASGDGDAEWSSSMDDVGGSSAVNAIRFVIPTLEANMTASPYFGVPMTRTTDDLETSTPLGVFWQVDSDQTDLQQSTFDPTTQSSSGLGGRALAVGAMVKVTTTWDSSTAALGDQRTVTATPTLTSSSGNATGVLTAKDVSLTINVPAGMTVVQNSWLPAATPEVTENTDGSTDYTFAVVDLSSEEDITGITLTVTIDSDVATPSTLTATSTISSSSDLTSRSSSAAVAVNALAAFSATTTIDDAAILPDVPVTYHVALRNGLTGSVGPGKVVSVLPFEDDGRGTTGLGTLTLTGLEVTQGDVVIEYTTDAAADVYAATESDLSGETGVTWQTWPADGSVPDSVTAVRFSFDTLASSDSILVDMTVVADSIAYGGEVVSTLSGTVTTTSTEVTLDGAARTELFSGTGRITGSVYHDVDYSWALDGDDTGIEGIPVTVTGYTYGEDLTDDGGSGDDVTVTADDAIVVETDADGSYVIDGITLGNWTLTVDDSLAALDGLMAAETPDQVQISIASDVTAVNFGYIDEIDAPVLVDDSVEVAAGADAVVSVLDNDTADDSAVISEVTQPAAGSVTIAADGLSVTYAAPAGASQETSFTYTVTDKARQSATATVTVSVVAPSAVDGALTVGQSGGTLDLSTLVTGLGLTGLSVTDGANGTTSLSGDVVTYTPADGFYGTDSFTYSITDEAGTEVSGTITVTVVRGPQVADDSVWTPMGTAIAIAVTQNDPYVGDGTVTVSSDPSNGSASVTGAGEITYTPADGFLGTDTFEYTVTDAEGQSDTATVTVEVVRVLTAADDTANTGVGLPVEVDVLANDAGTDIAVTGVSDVSEGASAEIGSDGVVTYTPVSGFVGEDTFTYTITDSVGGTTSAQVTVTVHAAPVAEALSARTGEATAVSVDALASVTGTATPLTGSVTTAPANGQVTVADDGTATYTPEAGFSGTETVVITWTDAVGQTSTQDLTIEVVAAPEVSDHSASILNGASVAVDLLEGSSGDALTVTSTTTPVGGTLVLDESTGLWTYTATAGFSGVDTVTYTVTDSVGQTASGKLVVEVAALPSAPAVSTRTGVSMATTIDLIAAGAGGTVTAVNPYLAGSVGYATSSTTEGVVVLNADGTVTFTPTEGYVGTTAFGYTVADDLGQTATGEVTVEVVALTADALTVQISGSTRTVVDVLSSVQGTGTSVTSVGDAEHGTVELVDGQVIYTPASGWTGTDTFTVVVTDEFGQTVTVTVTAVVQGGSTPTPTPSPSSTAGDTGTSGDGTSTLAITGAQFAGVLAGALALLAAGGWLLMVWRRRTGEQTQD